MHIASTHAALVVSASGEMQLEQVPTDRPQVGEMLVAPLRVGICGSDLDVMRGSRPRGTRILGHEGVAEVVEVGPGVSGFAVGQYVTFWPNNPQNPADILGVSSDGLFQQYLVVTPAALERGMVVACEPAIPPVCGPLIEPFATVLYGQALVNQVCQPAQAVVVGAGPIGLLNVLSLREQGCSSVFLVDTSQARLDWAVQRGMVAEAEALPGSPQLAEALLDRAAGQPLDAAFLCTPRSATRPALEHALRYVREDGCISLTAGTDSREAFPSLPGVDLDGIRQANYCGLGHEVRQCVTQEGKRLWLTGHSGASAAYLQEAMQRMLKQPGLYAKVISHVVSYAAAPRVFAQLLAASPQSIAGGPRVKVIIDFTNDGQEITVFEPPD